jgi:hypothetical protein
MPRGFVRLAAPVSRSVEVVVSRELPGEAAPGGLAPGCRVLLLASPPPDCATTMLSLPADASAATGSAKAPVTATAIRVLIISHLQG